MDLEHHTKQVKDVRLHYATMGSGPPVLLLHGWPQTWVSWRSVMSVVAEHHLVIAPDLRGMGATSKPDTGYDTDNVADDLHELMRSLGHDAVFVAGHDWGGATAYAYAAQFRDEVRRLAIYEMVLPGFGLIEGAMVPREGGDFLWHMGFQSVPDMPQALLQGREEMYLRWFFEKFAYDPVAAMASAGTYVQSMQQVGALRAGLEYYKSFFVSAAQNAEHAKVPLAMPVAAWGGEACLGPLTKQCLELAADDVRGGVLERCGHWVAEERPELIAEQLLEFFGEEAR